MKTFRLLLLSGTILLSTILVATFWDALGLGANKVALAASTTIAFGISIAGLMTGVNEMKGSKTTLFWIGFIGHFVVIGIFLLSIFFAVRL